MASTRRAAREAVIKTLFQIDLGGMEAGAAFATAVSMDDLDSDAVEFARDLSLGAIEHRADIDKQIGQLSRSWAVSRLAAVDRAILRMAAYEILYRSDIPVSASINEAVELAKIYSTPESGRFVNGVLGALARAVRGAEAPGTDVTGAVEDIVVPGEAETVDDVSSGEASSDGKGPAGADGEGHPVVDSFSARW